MTKAELLRQATEAVNKIVAERKANEQETHNESEASKIALQLASTDAIVEAIKDNKIPTEDIVRAFTEAVSKIKIDVPKADVPKAQVEVKIPEIKLPEIKLPPINVPKPEVTVNMPEVVFPKFDAPVVNFELPERISVGLEDFTLNNPLPTISVDPAGKFVSPVSGGGGRISNKPQAKLPDGQFTEIRADGLAFQTFKVIGNGETYDSGVLSLEGFTQVQTNVLSDVTGTITINFIRDAAGTDVLRTLTIPYATADLNIYRTFAAPAFTPYVRYRFTATQAGQTDFYFDTKFLTTALSPQTLGVDAFISPLMVANLGRNVLVGLTPAGQYENVGVTNQRSLKVTPPQEGKTSFGEALTGSLVDQVLVDYAFGNIDGIVTTKANQSGSVTNANQLGTVSTGAAANSSGQIETNVKVRYVPGHGNRARFTAKFTTGVADSTQLAGIGDESNGFFFGYDGTSFGILHRKNGSPEIRTLTISQGANNGTGTDDITITLDGDAKTVTLTDFSGTASITANEIAAADYSDTGRGWTAKAYGNTVVFSSWDAAVHTGTYSLVDTDSTGAAGTFAQTVAGAVPSETWIPQASWNGEEIFDGTGVTGNTLVPTNLNVYQIQYQYLGAGNIFFFVEDEDDGEFHLVHTIKYANANTTTSLGNPNLPLTILAENAANTTNLSVSSASMAGMTDGDVELVGNRRALSANSGSISAATPVIIVKNDPVFNSKKNTNKIKILSISTTSTIASGKSTVTIDLRKNATITAASYTQVDASNSFTSYDTAATAATNGTVIASEQSIVDVVTRFDSADPNDLVLEPGETLTVVATPSNNNTTVYVSIRFVELL